MARIITPPFTVSYPNLLTPKKNDLNGKYEYSCVALFKKGEGLTKIHAAILEAMTEKWGPDKKKWPPKAKSPLRLQDEKEITDPETGKKSLPNGLEYGAYFMNLKTAEKPAVVDEDVQPIIDSSQIYPGCKMIASVNFYAYDQKGNRGVGVGLNNIQKVADGNPLVNRPKPEDDFKPVARAAGTSADSIFN